VTALSPSDRADLEDLLMAERASTTSQIEALARDLGGIIDASTSVATDDEHDPEGATIAFERAQVAALLSLARERLVDLNRALERLGEGTYDMCERCGQPIAAERLAARPAARTCIGCASARRR
jgi:RNA polymerase-binding transcription factor DksA